MIIEKNVLLKVHKLKKKVWLMNPQKVLIFGRKKVFTSWIRTHNLNASQLLYPLSHMAVAFNGMLLEFSPLLCLQPAAERKLITALPRDDKLG